MTKEAILQVDKDLLREGLTKYTRKAYRMLPKLNKPRILDIGCGPGIQTMELARFSQGEIIGVDIHQPSLDRLTRKVEETGLSDSVKAVNCSMFEMDFPDESFDILWAEGSIFIIGFERGLKEWQRFLKPDAFLVVHDMIWLHPDPPQGIYDYWKGIYPGIKGIKTVPEYLRQVPGHGYDIIGHFSLPEDAWWSEYYEPLEKRVAQLRMKYINDPEALSVLDKEQREIDIFKKCCKWYGSAFFIMQKK